MTGPLPALRTLDRPIPVGPGALPRLPPGWNTVTGTRRNLGDLVRTYEQAGMVVWRSNLTRNPERAGFDLMQVRLVDPRPRYLPAKAKRRTRHYRRAWTIVLVSLLITLAASIAAGLILAGMWVAAHWALVLAAFLLAVVAPLMLAVMTGHGKPAAKVVGFVCTNVAHCLGCRHR